MHSARRGDDGADGANNVSVPGGGKEENPSSLAICSKCMRTPAGGDGIKTSVCSGCMTTRYCSDASCQRDDWKEHKLVCAHLGAVREETLKQFENTGPGSARRNLKNDTIANRNWYFAVPGLASRVDFLAWKHRRESPIITVETQSIGADAVPNVTVIPRAQWDDDNAREDVNRVIARATFARSDLNEDSQYLLLLSVPVDEQVSDVLKMRAFPLDIRLIYDSVFTTLTADAFVAEVLRRERFPRRAEIIVRLHGLVGRVVTPGCHSIGYMYHTGCHQLNVF
jgi:hypothetical protein